MYFTLISILIIIDQAIKWISRTKLTKFESYPVIDGFFHFTYVENRGAAFGMLQNKTWFFVLINTNVGAHCNAPQLIFFYFILFYFKIIFYSTSPSG